jgi:hypothetical protein
MFRASNAHLQEDTVVHMQHMVLSLRKQVSGRVLLLVLLTLGHSPVYTVTVPYAACVQLYPPEDEHSRLETCRGEYYFMNK